ncbi:MAG: hypothetical protein HC890_17955 [Chloroflexaceae bacterium]|nr:hypothetical protein [Chloroflexaceae bacterium]
MLLPYALKTSEFGPVTTAAIARQMPIFSEIGRKEFFYERLWESWVCGERCGLAPYDWCKHIPPFQAFLMLSLPWLGRWPHRFPLVRKVSRDSLILLNILLVSLGMFSLAHIFLFKLHLPSRYTKHSIRILVAIGGAIAGVILFQALWRACRRRQNRALTAATLGLSLFLLFGYPLAINSYPNPDYVQARSPALYQFFAEQPKTLLSALYRKKPTIFPPYRGDRCW